MRWRIRSSNRPTREIQQITTETALAVQDPMQDTKIRLAQYQADLDALPRYTCNSCAVGPECKGYEINAVCKFEKAFRAFPVREQGAVEALLGAVVDKNKERFLRAVYHEQVVGGGVPDANVTHLSETLVRQIDRLRGVGKRGVNLTVVDGGGVLSKLFGGAQVPPAGNVLNPILDVDSEDVTGDGRGTYPIEDE